MDPRHHNSFLHSVLKSTRLPIYIFLAATSLAVLSRAALAFQQDLFSDDAYYYTVVARNFVELGRFTFDGISETNGFHPLLLWIQVPLAAILGPDVSPLVFYRALVVLYSLILLGFVSSFSFACQRLARSAPTERYCQALILSVGFCFLPNSLPLFFNGMESIVAFPLCASVVILVYSRRYVVAGFVSALLVAARLDTFTYFIIPLVLLYGFYEFYRCKSLVTTVITTLKLILPTTIFLLLYTSLNYSQFGAWMPIHGALKSSFPRLNVQLHQMVQYHSFLSFLAAIVGCASLVRRRESSERVQAIGLILAAVTLAQLAGFALFQKWAKMIPLWYRGLPLFTSLTSLAIGIVNYLPSRVLKILVMCLSLLLLLVSGISFCSNLHRSAVNPSFTADPRREVSQFIKSQPADSLWAYTDCGKFAFWSEQRIVNLDGLINNFEFQDRLGQRELQEYLEERGVRYIIAGVWDQRQTLDLENELMYGYRVAPEAFSGDYDYLYFYVYSYLHGTYSDQLVLPKAAEIWRSSGHVDGKARARWIVYDMRVVAEYPGIVEGK